MASERPDKPRLQPQRARAAITNTAQIEEGTVFAPKFDDNGVVPAIVTDAQSGQVLMLAYMNAEALARTLETREAHYWSRSRGRLWRKGETSGHVQTVVEVRTDCDQDAVWLRVSMGGAGACHTGRRSCFYRAVSDSDGARLVFVDDERVFDPAAVYGAKT
jgi:phosphoribosyl-AMP cyclohydrolase